MSALSDFFTQAGFWWGVPAGAIVAGSASSLITARSVRNSDERKAAQEDKIQTRKEQHERQMAEDKAEREAKTNKDQLTRERCSDFLAVATDIFATATDSKGTFNDIRDQFYNDAGLPDPKVEDKLDFATALANETARIGSAYNQLRLVATKPILDAAMGLNLASMAMFRAMTTPQSKPLMAQSFGENLEAFMTAVRSELGLDVYSEHDAAKKTATYMETLREQVTVYLEQAKQEMTPSGVHNPYGRKRSRP